jgi:hemerythrin superfamily protein
MDFAEAWSMDAIEFLTKQHRMVDGLFLQIEKTDDPDIKEQLFTQLADALAIHAKLEEMHFYPAAKSADTEDSLKEAVEEHLAVKRILADMLDLDADDDEFDAKCTVLKEQVQHHVKEEEDELFPQAREHIGKEKLAALAKTMQELQAELETQEPRLSVPDEIDEAAPI